MYYKNRIPKTSLKLESGKEGETIEQKVRRIMNNKEPITDGAPLIFTERKDGVQPQYDVRTDRFELAVDSMDLLTKQKLAQREGKPEGIKIDKNKPDGNTEGSNKGDNKGDNSTNATGGNQEPKTPEAK